MKWTFTVENKIKASVTLLILCGVVLFSNYRLKKLSNKVADSVETIYKDRLLVQDLIFSYSQLIESLGDLNEDAFEKNDLVSSKVNVLNARYLETKLTDEEAQVFKQFTQQLSTFISSNKAKSEEGVDMLRSNLDRLEEIQMEEAKIEMEIISQINGRQEIGFYLETAILVILLVIVQVLVVTSTAIKRASDDGDFNLN